MVSPDIRIPGTSVRAPFWSRLRGSWRDSSVVGLFTLNLKHFRARRLASALSLAFPMMATVGGAHADTVTRVDAVPSLDPVWVVGSRFPTGGDDAPLGATVITAEQIRASGVSNVNEAIRKLGAVFGRQNLTGTSDASLDLRGFGSTSDQNLVIMIDGVRLNEIDLATPLLSSIPLDSVERIEIVRGGSSVLYGDGATGGTIQIITRRARAGQQYGSAAAEIGSYGHREGRASLFKGWDNVAIDVNTSIQRADNYRANSKVAQDNASLGLQYFTDDTRVGIKLHASSQESGLPGWLTLDQFRANPRQATNLKDVGKIDATRTVVYMEKRVGAWEFFADLAHRDKTNYADQPSQGGIVSLQYSADQFSPRVRHLSGHDALRNEFVAGADVLRASRHGSYTYGTFSFSGDEYQNSAAVYARDEVRFGDTRIAAGVRREEFEQSTNSRSSQFGLNAWDLQVGQQLAANLQVFAKAGRSYRVANIEENAYVVSLLKPQTSNDTELGAKWGDSERSAGVKWFRHALRNEIIFNREIGAMGSNVNLDPTRREGFELELRAALTSSLSAVMFYQHVSSTFTEGAYVGKKVFLAPDDMVQANLTWKPATGHTGTLAWQWVSSQRWGNDFSNTCAREIPSYSTIDGRYAIRSGPWEFAVVGTNLTDHSYFSTAYESRSASQPRCSDGIYPDPGRALRLTVRRDF